MLLAAPSFLVPGIFGARSEEQQFLLGEMRHSTAFGAPPIQIKPAQAIVLCSGFMVSQILHFPSCIILQPCESQGSHGGSHPQWPQWPPRICGPLACCSMPCLAARCPSNLLRPPGKATSRWRPRNGTAFRLKPRTLVTDGHASLKKPRGYRIHVDTWRSTLSWWEILGCWLGRFRDSQTWVWQCHWYDSHRYGSILKSQGSRHPFFWGLCSHFFLCLESWTHPHHLFHHLAGLDPAATGRGASGPSVRGQGAGTSLGPGPWRSGRTSELRLAATANSYVWLVRLRLM